MKKVALLFFSLLIFLTASATDSSLYQITVPVASQSQNDWQKGIVDALTQVIVKVSGNDDVLKSKNIKDALTQAPTYVQGFTYVAMSSANNSTDSLMLQVQFYPQAINQLLQSAGSQSWAKKQRPVTLVWLAIQTPQGQTIINNTSTDIIANALQANANNRGLPILLPIMDLQDMQKVGVHDVWQLESQGVIDATKRYGANNILEAKVYADNKQNQWYAQWLFISNGQTISGNAQSASANEVMATMLNKVANNIANKNANNATQTQIVLAITNVNGLDDYADIVKYLRSLPSVINVEVGNIDPDNVTVNITINGGPETLISDLNAGIQMQMIPNENPDNKVLTYRWNTPANSASNNKMQNVTANTANDGIDMGS